MESETNIYEWLKKNQMTIKTFTQKIGCHRQTARYINAKKPISVRTALAVMIFTAGEIKPVHVNIGRPRKLSTK